MAAAIQSRYWCFTSHADTRPLWDSKVMDYLVYQREQGTNKEDSAPHWQGYVEFTSVRRLSAVKTFIGDSKMHCEVKKGTRTQATNYCKKPTGPDNIVIHPFREHKSVRYIAEAAPREGKQCLIDYSQQADFAKAGKLDDVAPVVVLKHPNGVRMLLSMEKFDKVYPTELYIYYGPSGTGKTTAVKQFAERHDLRVYVAPPSGWFCRYDGEEIILFDEFRGAATCPPEMLFQMCDTTSVLLPTKGGQVPHKAKYIFITSHMSPDYWPGYVASCTEKSDPQRFERENRLPELYRRASHFTDRKPGGEHGTHVVLFTHVLRKQLTQEHQAWVTLAFMTRLIGEQYEREKVFEDIKQARKVRRRKDNRLVPFDSCSYFPDLFKEDVVLYPRLPPVRHAFDQLMEMLYNGRIGEAH